MQKFTLLMIGLVFSASALAVERANPTNALIIDRPSAERPELPKYVPKEMPSFKLPPVNKVLLHRNEDTVKIQLNGIQFIGNTVIDETELQAIAKPFIGKAATVADLEDLRQRVSQYYLEQGYVNSGAVLPDQQFKNGIITMQIIEGKLSEIRVQGTEWLEPSYISDRLYDHDEQEVLNVNVLRENFQQLLLDPLIDQMNGSLLPSSQRGESILDVNVVRARPYQLTLTADNYQPPSIGSTVGHLGGWVRNLTGLGDMLSGSVAYSEGLIGGSGSYSIPLNAQNTRFHFYIDRNDTTIIEQTLQPLDIRSRYVNVDFGLTHPFINSLNRNFNVGISFNYKKNRTSMLNEPFDFSEGSVNGITKDSVLRFTLDFTERFEKQVLSVRSTTSVGINAFDATWHKNSALPDGNFVSWLGQLQYGAQLFDSDANIVLRGDVQYSDNKLMPLERFALGGRYSVRGYRENQLVRDKGYALSAELRYPLLKDDSEYNLGTVTIFPFMDYGAAQNRGDRKNIVHLYSVGMGLEWQLSKQFSTELIYAHALNRPPQVPKADYDLQDSGFQWRVNFSAF
ncbi:Heme/hemopexin transporter protein HuxB [Patescibacteria group bacterium]|nr:Heme/hemopexin transporter protein HuxB [Patescibacteria group bacterium]